MGKIPRELAPYFDVCYILCFGTCEHCHLNMEFVSSHPQFSEEWWLDEAAAMKNQGWVVSELLVAHCAQCAQQLGLSHDQHAHSFRPEDLE